MKKTNALKMRQNLGKVLRGLQKGGRPVLVEKDRRPAAVLISLEDYNKRFVDVEADRLRNEIVEKIKGARIKLPPEKSSLDIIRNLRVS